MQLARYRFTDAERAWHTPVSLVHTHMLQATFLATHPIVVQTVRAPVYAPPTPAMQDGCGVKHMCAYHSDVKHMCV